MMTAASPTAARAAIPKRVLLTGFFVLALSGLFLIVVSKMRPPTTEEWAQSHPGSGRTAGSNSPSRYMLTR
jgi:hypothetical protein